MSCWVSLGGRQYVSHVERKVAQRAVRVCGPRWAAAKWGGGSHRWRMSCWIFWQRKNILEWVEWSPTVCARRDPLFWIIQTWNKACIISALCSVMKGGWRDWWAAQRRELPVGGTVSSSADLRCLLSQPSPQSSAAPLMWTKRTHILHFFFRVNLKFKIHLK